MIEPHVSAIAIIGAQIFVLRLQREQLTRREAGELVTAEIFTVIPTSEAG